MKEQLDLGSASFSPMIKAVSSGCNLNCDYCFYSGSQSEVKRMSERTLKTITGNLVEASSQPVHFIWHGGEPTLMGLDFYQLVVDVQREALKPDRRITNSLQTNGTLINEKWASFFKQNNWTVGVSIDGPCDLHNLSRKNKVQKGSFNASYRGLNILREAGTRLGCIAVINSQTRGNTEDIMSFFRDLRVPVKLNQCTAYPKDPIQIKALEISSSEYAKFLMNAFNKWIDFDDPNYVASPLQDLVKMVLGYRGSSCIFKGACHRFLSVDYNGDVYPCDEFLEQSYLLGNLVEQGMGEISSSRDFQEYYQGRKDILKSCQGCKWLEICNGGCMREWNGAKTIDNPQKEDFCQARQWLFSSIEEDLARRGYRKGVNI